MILCTFRFLKVFYVIYVDAGQHNLDEETSGMLSAISTFALSVLRN